MRRIRDIAIREFLATVLTRGFVVGVLLLPGLIALSVVVGPRLMNQRSEQVRGQIAIIDPTGAVASELRATITPQAIAERRNAAAQRAIAGAPAEVRELAGESRAVSGPALERVLGAAPVLRVVERPAEPNDDDLRSAKAWLLETSPGDRHIAVVAVQPDAVRPGPGRQDYGGYTLYVPQNLDDRIETVIFESMRDALIGARARDEHIDRQRVNALVRVNRPGSITVSKGAERPTVVGFNRLLPFVFAGLLLFSVLMAGQGLVTSTVEEKTSRVIEVLLSAVSPLELLAGKVLGQMCVSLAVLGIYLGLAFMMMVSFAVLGLLDLSLVFYLLVFFVISYLTIGSAMAAVGSAVNDMREAQTMMMPIILIMMVPWMLALPISREPNSTFSTALSFMPPMNTFAMLLRLTSTAPPPRWQVWVTIGVGILSVAASVWCAAKVFTVGLLMYGKPPDLKTLIRWIRQARTV
jgi:ABC-2 type transport system permease protein